MVFCQKDANGIAKSEDSDRSSLIWVCTVWPDQSVQKLRAITVIILNFQADRSEYSIWNMVIPILIYSFTHFLHIENTFFAPNESVVSPIKLLH